jgi:hypothetical protein
MSFVEIDLELQMNSDASQTQLIVIYDTDKENNEQ